MLLQIVIRYLLYPNGKKLNMLSLILMAFGTQNKWDTFLLTALSHQIFPACSNTNSNCAKYLQDSIQFT